MKLLLHTYAELFWKLKMNATEAILPTDFLEIDTFPDNLLSPNHDENEKKRHETVDLERIKSIYTTLSSESRFIRKVVGAFTFVRLLEIVDAPGQKPGHFTRD